MSPDLLAALSEGQRALAHLAIVLGLLAAAATVGAVHLVRRKARRPDPPGGNQRIPEEEH